MTVGGSIASLGSPEPPAVVFPMVVSSAGYTLSTIQEASWNRRPKPWQWRKG